MKCVHKNLSSPSLLLSTGSVVVFTMTDAQSSITGHGCDAVLDAS